jgi:hypothetical protein
MFHVDESRICYLKEEILLIILLRKFICRFVIAKVIQSALGLRIFMKISVFQKFFGLILKRLK